MALGRRWGTMGAAACLSALSALSGYAPAQAADMAAPGAGTLRFKGMLRDTAFRADQPIRLEVLETGDTLGVRAGIPFTAFLPRDTLWNLCFSAAAGSSSPSKSPSASAANAADSAGSAGSASPSDSADAAKTAGADTSDPMTDAANAGRLEKCYELRYRGTDTAFASDIGADQSVWVESAPEAGPAAMAAAQDSLPADSASGTFASDDAIQLKKVLVRAQRAPKRSLGKSTVSAKLIKRMPGLAEADVIRSIQALPGVVSSSDFSTKIYVRGGASDQNLILLDRAVVYSPVHFFGLFSTFLVEGIDEVNFYKGGFPPEYGNRLSSVLDIKSRKGGKEQTDTWFKGSSIKISTFASQLHTEGRQGPVRWLVAGRRTYIDEVLAALRDQGLTDLILDYYFYDLQGNVSYDVAKDKTMMLSWYNGRDLLDFSPFKVEWGNTIIPWNYSQSLGKDLGTSVTASYSHFSQSFGIDKLFAFYNRIVTASYKQSLEYSGIDSHRLTAGVDVNWMEANFTNDQIIAKIKVKDITRFWLNSLYLQDKWSLGQAEITSGLRLTHSTVLDEPGIEPRLSLKYKLPRGQSLDLHTGYYKQYLNSIQFSDQESLNEFYYPAKKVSTRTVNPTSSLLFSAGYGVEKIRGEWDFTLEGYYKTLNHLTVFAPNEKPDSVSRNPNASLGDLFKEAQGYSFGFEASLRRPEGLIFGGLSYSNGTSVIMEDNSSTPYFPSWHQPHSFKADLAINWLGKDGLWGAKRKKYLRTSTQAKYATGLPYTEYVGYENAHLLDQNQGQQAGGPNPEFEENIFLQRGNRNTAFVPAYFRWDFKAIDWGREGKWNFSWTILNITNHENIFFYTYDRQTNPPEQIKITQFPNFPFLVNYEYYF